MKKRLVATILCIVMAVSLFCVTAFAEESFGQHDILSPISDCGAVYMGTIPANCVPDGVVPLEVTSMEEAEKIIAIYSTGTIQTTPTESSFAVATATANDYDVEITRTQYGGIFSSGLMATELRVSYNIVNDRISNASPYTSTYGVPIFADYTESSCTGYVIANTDGKEYYAISKGQIDYYIIIEGITNFYTAPVSLSGQKKLVP